MRLRNYLLPISYCFNSQGLQVGYCPDPVTVGYELYDSSEVLNISLGQMCSWQYPRVELHGWSFMGTMS